MTEKPVKHQCHKCHKDMLTTPVCVDCGIIPLADGAFALLECKIKQLERENEMLRIRISLLEIFKPACVV